LVEKHETGATFHPEMSAGSRRILARVDVRDISSGMLGKAATEIIRKEQSDAFHAKHPFTPALTARSRDIVEQRARLTEDDGGAGVSGDAIYRRQQRKESALEQKRKEKADLEIQHCTFKPKLTDSRDAAKALRARPKVKGIDGFLRTRERQRALDREKERHERRVFREDAILKHVERGQTTKPEPFNLTFYAAKDEDAQTHRRCTASAHAQEDKELTFKPFTLEAKHGELLRGLLYGS
jgi:predicted kinase